MVFDHACTARGLKGKACREASLPINIIRGEAGGGICVQITRFVTKTKLNKKRFQPGDLPRKG